MIYSRRKRQTKRNRKSARSKEELCMVEKDREKNCEKYKDRKKE